MACVVAYRRSDARGADKLIRAMSKDPASYRARIPTPAGIIEIERTNPQEKTKEHSIGKNGEITAEDQASLDALDTRGQVISAKLVALDAITPPPVPT